jgi:hypothetical protein
MFLISRRKRVRNKIGRASISRTPLLERLEGRTLLSFTPIPLPDAAYLGSTTLLPFTAPDGQLDTTVGLMDSQDSATMFVSDYNFGSSRYMTYYTVPGGPARGWSSPPYSETSLPRYVYTRLGAFEVDIDLASTSYGLNSTKTFGVEIEPVDLPGYINDHNYDITVVFYHANVQSGEYEEAGRIEQVVGADHGARLFAASSPEGFNKVAIVSLYGSLGIAQVRYSLDGQLPDLAMIQPTWNAAQGGVDLGYTISGADLAQPTTSALYWSADTTFDPSQDTVIPGSVTTTRTAQTPPGTSVPVHVDAAALATMAPPIGTKYLLAVVNPPGPDHIPESDESNGDDPNDTASLPLSDIQMLAATESSSQTVEFTYQVTGPDLGLFQVGVYRSADREFEPGIDIPLGSLITVSGSDATSGEHHGTWQGSLPIDPAHPYVLVVANPSGTVPESDARPGDQNDVASFRKWTIGAVTNGLLPLGDLQLDLFGDWVTAMAHSLQSLISPEGTTVGYDDVIPFIWGNTSNLPIPGLAIAAGQHLTQMVRDHAQSLAAQMGPNDVIDLHLIGHSRGAIVISQAFLDLMKDGGIPQLSAGYKEMTMLDPHPANSLGSSLVSFNPRSRVSQLAQAIDLLFCQAASDPNVVVPADVDLAEDYYEHTPWNQTTDLIGHYIINLWGVGHIPGAVDHDLSHAAPWMAHTRVTDWYQQYVIPELASPPYWQQSVTAATSLMARTTPGSGDRSVSSDAMMALAPDLFQPASSAVGGLAPAKKRTGPWL